MKDDKPIRASVQAVIDEQDLTCVEIAALLRHLADLTEVQLPEMPDIFKDGENWEDDG